MENSNEDSIVTVRRSTRNKTTAVDKVKPVLKRSNISLPVTSHEESNVIDDSTNAAHKDSTSAKCTSLDEIPSIVEGSAGEKLEDVAANEAGVPTVESCEDNEWKEINLEDFTVISEATDNISDSEAIGGEIDAKAKNKLRKKIEWDGPSVVNFGSGVTEIYGSKVPDDARFSKVVLIGDSFLNDLYSSWPQECVFRPFFIWKKMLTIRDLTGIVKYHRFLKNSNNCLVILFLGNSDIISFVKYKKCSVIHEKINLPAAMKRPTDVNRLRMLKEDIEKLHPNCHFAFANLPAVNFTLIVDSILSKYHRKFKKCTCRYIQTGKIQADYDTEVKRINQQIFNKKLSQIQSSCQFIFTGLEVVYEESAWKLPSTLALPLAIQLCQRLSAVILPNEKLISSQMRLFSEPGTLTRVPIYILGDNWLQSVSSTWEHFFSNFYPLFVPCENYNFSALKEFILSAVLPDEPCVIITSIGAEYFLSYKDYDCKEHLPLKYPVPNACSIDELRKQILDGMQDISSMLESRKNCKLFYMTCYPTAFKVYLRFIKTKHLNKYNNCITRPLMTKAECMSSWEKMNENMSAIDEIIVNYNMQNGCHTCDIGLLMRAVVGPYEFLYPSFLEGCPPKRAVKKLSKLIKEYVHSISTLVQQRKIVFDNSQEEMSNFQPRKAFHGYKGIVVTIKNTDSHACSIGDDAKVEDINASPKAGTDNPHEERKNVIELEQPDDVDFAVESIMMVENDFSKLDLKVISECSESEGHSDNASNLSAVSSICAPNTGILQANHPERCAEPPVSSDDTIHSATIIAMDAESISSGDNLTENDGAVEDVLSISSDEGTATKNASLAADNIECSDDVGNMAPVSMDDMESISSEESTIPIDEMEFISSADSAHGLNESTESISSEENLFVPSSECLAKNSQPISSDENDASKTEMRGTESVSSNDMDMEKPILKVTDPVSSDDNKDITEIDADISITSNHEIQQQELDMIHIKEEMCSMEVTKMDAKTVDIVKSERILSDRDDKDLMECLKHHITEEVRIELIKTDVNDDNKELFMPIKTETDSEDNCKPIKCENTDKIENNCKLIKHAEANCKPVTNEETDRREDNSKPIKSEETDRTEDNCKPIKSEETDRTKDNRKPIKSEENEDNLDELNECFSANIKKYDVPIENIEHNSNLIALDEEIDMYVNITVDDKIESKVVTANDPPSSETADKKTKNRLRKVRGRHSKSGHMGLRKKPTKLIDSVSVEDKAADSTANISSAVDIDPESMVKISKRGTSTVENDAMPQEVKTTSKEIVIKVSEQDRKITLQARKIKAKPSRKKCGVKLPKEESKAKALAEGKKSKPSGKQKSDIITGKKKVNLTEENKDKTEESIIKESEENKKRKVLSINKDSTSKKNSISKPETATSEKIVVLVRKEDERATKKGQHESISRTIQNSNSRYGLIKIPINQPQAVTYISTPLQAQQMIPNQVTTVNYPPPINPNWPYPAQRHWTGPPPHGYNEWQNRSIQRCQPPPVAYSTPEPTEIANYPRLSNYKSTDEKSVNYRSPPRKRYKKDSSPDKSSSRSHDVGRYPRNEKDGRLSNTSSSRRSHSYRRSRSPRRKHRSPRRRSRSPHRRSRSPRRRDRSPRRSRSPRRRGRSPGRRSFSPRHSSQKEKISRISVERVALESLRAVHDKECDMYRNNPEAHPDFSKEKRSWFQLMGVHHGYTSQSYFLQEKWKSLWLSKMEDNFDKCWEDKKIKCLSLLPSGKRRSRSSDRSSKRHKSRKSERSPQYSQNLSYGSSNYPLPSTSFDTVDALERKIEEYIKRSSSSYSVDTNFSPFSDHTTYPSTSTGKISYQPQMKELKSKSPNVLEVTAVLSDISDRFGNLGPFIRTLHNQLTRDSLMKKNLMEALTDDDSLLLLKMVSDQLSHFLGDSSKSVVQKAIYLEAQEKLGVLLKAIKRSKKPFSPLQLESLRNLTRGMDMMQTLKLIKENLKLKERFDPDDQEVMDVYIALKASEKDKSSMRGDSSQFNLDANQGQQRSHLFGILPTKPASKIDKIKTDFKNMSNVQKLDMFKNFNNLAFEEKSVLLSYLDETDTSNPHFAQVLRMMINERRS